MCSQLHSEVEKPLLTFRGDNFKKDLKKYDHHIADLRKQLASRYAGVEKVKKKKTVSFPFGLSTSQRSTLRSCRDSCDKSVEAGRKAS